MPLIDAYSDFWKLGFDAVKDVAKGVETVGKGTSNFMKDAFTKTDRPFNGVSGGPLYSTNQPKKATPFKIPQGYHLEPNSPIQGGGLVDSPLNGPATENSYINRRGQNTTSTLQKYQNDNQLIAANAQNQVSKQTTHQNELEK